jgi:hypothetical protein
MSKGQMYHDLENCHDLDEKPTERQEIIINTNEHPSGLINLGYYANGKWFLDNNIEIDVDKIMCWHDKDEIN